MDCESKRRELADWKRDVRRVAERRARRAWGECPKGRWLDAALEVIGMVVVVALFGGLTWLYVMATPDQVSAEADIGRAQLGHQHCTAANPAQLGHQHSRAANPAQLGHQHSRAANPAQLGHQHCTAANPAQLGHQHYGAAAKRGISR